MKTTFKQDFEAESSRLINFMQKTVKETNIKSY
jgi:hypothetical protein